LTNVGTLEVATAVCLVWISKPAPRKAMNSPALCRSHFIPSTVVICGSPQPPPVLVILGLYVREHVMLPLLASVTVKVN
jgi:hypothetical protein